MTSPPQTLLERLKFVGPGIVFAALAVGSGELLLTPRSGALYGYTLIWVPILVLAYKCCFSIVMSRYAVSQGRDLFRAVADLPGPRNWATYLVLFLYIVEMIGDGGIALLAGTAVYALFNPISMRLAGTATVLFIGTVLWKGSYTFLENFVKVLSVVLISGVVYNLRFAHVPIDQVAHGLIPSIPDTEDGLLTVMGLMGWIGSGTGTLLYSSWLTEKIGAVGRDKELYTQWMKTVRVDVVASYVFIGTVSLSFLILGVYVLGGQTGFKGGRETMMALSAMLQRFPYGRQVFLVTAYFALVNCLVSGVDGRGRAFHSLLWSIVGDRVDAKTIYRGTVIVYCSIMCLVCLAGEPVTVVTIIAACSGVGFGIFGYMLIQLNRGLPDHARSGRVLTTILLLGSTVYLAFAFVQSYKSLSGLFGG